MKVYTVENICQGQGSGRLKLSSEGKWAETVTAADAHNARAIAANMARLSRRGFSRECSNGHGLMEQI